jgi:acetyl esterase/lipase
LVARDFLLWYAEQAETGRNRTGSKEKKTMRHEIITLPQTGVELETYLTDNRAVEPGRRKPLVLVFPGGAYMYRSDREAEPVALRLQSLGIQAVIVRYSVAPAARYPKALEEAAEAVA